ncbi:LpqB family beta-propeller domain-containing protein [Sanguibacter suaedae]|uniref:GerMN domain-containing protein n=1 Tax=Sanguibacter suaedae TaxID=2795737 RepID=A0A934I5L2_9MICO|nr:LpqB family beta-propeller domain-containing protein [Sanguibacter suaedae]MBI9116029.1 GerMN domain-containing protein [Sanguibacter suaedae]
MTTAARARTALVVLCALLVAGCARIPVDGPVQRGDVSVTELGPIYLRAYGPPVDASPQAVVEGFLAAQAAGLNDDWSVAREYLGGEAARSWDPSARTVVYSGEAEIDQTAGPTTGGDTTDDATDGPTDGTDGTVDTDDAILQGSVSVVSTLDSTGRYTEAPPGSQQDLVFTLERDAQDQWRIVLVEDGLYVALNIFVSSYRPTSLYFPTSDGELLVPEVRWYPTSNTPSYAVNGLLTGPSEWLRDSVVTAVPDGTRLVVDAVTVVDGVARVDLTQDVLAADPQERAMLQAQLEAVLLRLRGVRAVEIFASSVPLTVAEEVDPERDPDPSTSVWVLADGVVSTLQGREVEPVPGILPLTGDVTALAVHPDGSGGVYRSGSTAVRTLPTEAQESVALLTGTRLLAPSVDRFGWVWTGEGAEGEGLVAVGPDGSVVEVAADWLSGRTVESVRVALDGARVAVVSSQAGVSQVDVAGIVRDDAAAPQRLSDATPIGATVQDPDQVVWVDESTLGVLATVGSSGLRTFHSVPLAGRSEALSGVDDAVAIAAGRGLRSVYVATAEGDLLGRSSTGTTWSTVATGVQLPTFPG